MQPLRRSRVNNARFSFVVFFMKKIDIDRLAWAVFQKHRDAALQFALKKSERYLRAANPDRSRLWFQVGEALVALEARHLAAMRLTDTLPPPEPFKTTEQK
jgi:hypothetical protein